ncbi:ABC transporter substrate-binding protein [Dyadobacter sp. Leaf189]|uniref:ABC transporter substrate-binding protein n=1 Tax=Dyadobacter sp. Leaf189 TaxID=1736295 RepID=UPI0006F39966|nr:ABC transporter substrate-binding protein [Dyadobacter sp. Leaf189]KQS30926.1 ABC transporter substrate-binding protein [Dyadobacter sp. Leaf189]
MNFKQNILLASLLFSLLLGCSSSSSLYERNEIRRGGNERFSGELQVKYAKGFRISYHKTFKVVQIASPFEKAADTITYLLVPRGSKRPKVYPEAQVIEIPVRSLVAMSSMHIGLAGFLEAEDVLVGLGNVQYVSSPRVIERIKAGRIVEVGKDQALNEEKLITMHPDLIMATGSPVSKMNHYAALQAAGIPVLINSEWVETTPLGRAEWVKLMGALLNKEAEVNARFAIVEKEYNRLAAMGRNAAVKPSVVTGMSSRDAWFVPNGNSYVCQFLQDAGATYHWSGTRATGSLPLSFEAVYPIALQADYWLNVSIGNITKKEQILGKDTRYADFKAFKSGQIFNYNKRTNEQGANDYWESGAVNPHEILADLIQILHPELMPGRELGYYRRVE